MRDTKSKNEKFLKSACGLGRMTNFANFGTLLKSVDRLRIQTRNFACTLTVKDTKRKNEKLAKQATEALILGKIRESIAFDFQHGYQMWTWFVNFLDQIKQKLILKTEYQFNTSV